MSCQNIKGCQFSSKIICENKFSRASDCFSDTLELKIFLGEVPLPPKKVGQPPLVLFPSSSGHAAERNLFPLFHVGKCPIFKTFLPNLITGEY